MPEALISTDWGGLDIAKFLLSMVQMLEMMFDLRKQSVTAVFRRESSCTHR
jgi:hypothetical protein